MTWGEKIINSYVAFSAGAAVALLGVILKELLVDKKKERER